MSGTKKKKNRQQKKRQQKKRGAQNRAKKKEGRKKRGRGAVSGKSGRGTSERREDEALFFESGPDPEVDYEAMDDDELNRAMEQALGVPRSVVLARLDGSGLDGSGREDVGCWDELGRGGGGSPAGICAPTEEAPALGYTNVLGVTYYLHAGRTKTGKPRYLVRKTIQRGGDGEEEREAGGPGTGSGKGRRKSAGTGKRTGKGAGKAAGKGAARPLTEMPEGYEFSESVNGVVSVRRVDSAATRANARIPESDVEAVRAEVARHAHLRGCKVAVDKGSIVIFEAQGGVPPELVRELMGMGMGLGMGQGGALPGLGPGARYEPVMRFESDDTATYAVFRMTYRGDGGWSHPLSAGPLKTLLRRYVRHIGTDGFYELM